MATADGAAAIASRHRDVGLGCNAIEPGSAGHVQQPQPQAAWICATEPNDFGLLRPAACIVQRGCADAQDRVQ